MSFTRNSGEIRVISCREVLKLRNIPIVHTYSWEAKDCCIQNDGELRFLILRIALRLGRLSEVHVVLHTYHLKRLTNISIK